jgi:hypothetical protein
MKLPRRRFLHMAATAAAFPATFRAAQAQAYPVRPIQLTVYFAAGGGNDIIARLMGQWLSERLGQPFVILNRPAGRRRQYRNRGRRQGRTRRLFAALHLYAERNQCHAV